MEMYGTNKLYEMDDDIDEFGVDHSNFSLRDELEYNQKIADEKQNNKDMETNDSFDNTGTQYAKNEYTNIANDGTTNNQDEGLYKTTWDNVKKFEDIKLHPYNDANGFITVGGGNNIDNWNDFKNVNFTVNDVPATDEQKLEAYNKLHQFANEKDADGKFINRNYKADSFKNMTDLRISDNEAYNLSQNTIKNDLSTLRKEYTDFNTYPKELQEVMMDLQYNTGNVTQKNWPRLTDGINRRDINYIADNVHRIGINDDRNQWARDKILSIRNW